MFLNMPSMKICLVVVLLVSAFSFTSLAIPIYWSHFCSHGSGDTVFVANRNNLLSYLSNATGHDGFYNTTVGQSPNVVRGLFLCRGDAIPENCQNCIQLATVDIAQRCPSKFGAIIWYSECMLHYSDQSFFALMEIEPKYIGPWFNVNVTVEEPESDHFNQLRETLTRDIATRASNASLGAKKFATKEGNYTALQTLYSLAQCLPDITAEDCLSCLQIAISYLRVCCKTLPSLALLPSCNVQYHITPFYEQGNRTAAEAPSPAPPPAPLLLPPTSPSPAPPPAPFLLPPTPPSPAPPPAPLLLPPTPPGKKQGKSPRIPIVASLSAVFGLTLLCSGGIFLWRRKYFRENEENNSQELELLELAGAVKLVNVYSNDNFQNEDRVTSQEFPSIQLDILHVATNHFSGENKLGEGGFGPVYKGTLPDGKEIAVKRLSRTSGQGLLEFKNEVMLIARLQHRNLVRLIGCCLEKNEKLLVYEYMPNKSLNLFLFDSSIGVQLDWQKRLSIIKGIARGILYLHEDSRLRIIHRDLKASNVLLDAEMNPKISDFGIARIFGRNQSEANTNRVAGTYGYMAPEYAMEGLFSVKSDVFSFGVLLLEIINGKRNNGFHFWERGESLLTFAWKLWSRGEGMKLLDERLVESCEATEVLKCIHIGLLCVQEDPADRPSMSSVILMLGSETITLPRPLQPAFSVGRVVVEPTRQPTSNERVCSVNEAWEHRKG